MLSAFLCHLLRQKGFHQTLVSALFVRSRHGNASELRGAVSISEVCLRPRFRAQNNEVVVIGFRAQFSRRRHRRIISSSSTRARAIDAAPLHYEADISSPSRVSLGTSCSTRIHTRSHS